MSEISISQIWSKTLMKLIFYPYGEFRWSPEGTVSQIHSSHLHVGAPEIFSDLLRSVQMLKRKWAAESNGKLPHLFIPSKTANLVPEFAVEDLPLGRTAALVLSLQWKTCPWAEHWWYIYNFLERVIGVPLLADAIMVNLNARYQISARSEIRRYDD